MYPIFIKEKEYIEFLKRLRIELQLTKDYGNTAFIIKPQIEQLSEVLQRCDKFYNVRQKKENPGPMTSFRKKPFQNLLKA